MACCVPACAGWKTPRAKNSASRAVLTWPTTPNAAHALALAALRFHGYRSGSRYLVFQCLQHTVDLPVEQWRVLDQAHRKRNLAEYEGYMDVDEQLVAATLRVAQEVAERVNERVKT